MAKDKCINPEGHDWETLWDDGARDCRICIHCSVERVFVHDAPEGIQDVANGWYVCGWCYRSA